MAKVTLPSDHLTEKQKREMSGEVKSYRLNDPMTWEEFKELPDDLKRQYIKTLRLRFEIPDTYIGVMLGIPHKQTMALMGSLGIASAQYKKDWKRDAFVAWCNDGRRPIVEPKPCAIIGMTYNAAGDADAVMELLAKRMEGLGQVRVTLTWEVCENDPH